jgi:hypothetical protein
MCCRAKMREGRTRRDWCPRLGERFLSFEQIRKTLHCVQRWGGELVISGFASHRVLRLWTQLLLFRAEYFRYEKGTTKFFCVQILHVDVDNNVILCCCYQSESWCWRTSVVTNSEQCVEVYSVVLISGWYKWNLNSTTKSCTRLTRHWNWTEAWSFSSPPAVHHKQAGRSPTSTKVTTTNCDTIRSGTPILWPKLDTACSQFQVFKSNQWQLRSSLRQPMGVEACCTWGCSNKNKSSVILRLTYDVNLKNL